MGRPGCTCRSLPLAGGIAPQILGQASWSLVIPTKKHGMADARALAHSWYRVSCALSTPRNFMIGDTPCWSADAFTSIRAVGTPLHTDEQVGVPCVVGESPLAPDGDVGSFQAARGRHACHVVCEAARLSEN